MFRSNTKRKVSKTFYVKNKRLALLSPLFFRLSLKKNVHLKRTFCVQKFGVEMHRSVKELRRVRG